MESPLISPTSFRSVPKPERKGHLPIRSIAYKKNLNEKDLEVKKEMMMTTMSKFVPSPLYSANLVSPTRASTHHGSKPSSAATFQPFMSTTFHKLSMASTKESPRKFQSHLLPNLRSARTPPAQTQPLYNYSEHHSKLLKSKTKEVLHTVSPQEDYFKLLFDENRKTFKVEDYEGVDEYYTDDMIKTRILSQGFRDPEYFSRRNEFTDMYVPDETTIREEYRLKMPAVISTMENNNTLATHVLGGTLNNISFVESLANTAGREIKGIKAEKKQIEQEVAEIKKKFENEVKNIEAGFLKRFEQLQSVIKEDFISSQNENFKVQKEIVLLQRDKLKLEKEIEESLVPLHHLEDVLYGREIFALEPNEERLNHVSSMNLRSEVQSAMKNKKIIH